MSSSSTEEQTVQEDTKGIYGILAQAIVQGVKSVMGAMASIDTKAGKPVMKRPDQSTEEVLGNMTFGVSGIIGFTGDAGRGSLALCFSKDCALGLTASLFGEEKAEIDKDVEDTIGEFTNMICGDARRRIAEEGMTLEAGLPTVVNGEGHSVNHSPSGFSFVIPFQSPNGPFAVEASFKRE
jgi:chemotaxis protein CheX